MKFELENYAVTMVIEKKLDYFFSEYTQIFNRNMSVYYSTLDRFPEHGLIVRRGTPYLKRSSRNRSKVE
jgi:hypothetical protein